MKKLGKFTAAAMALPLALSAVPLIPTDAGAAALPDWIPSSFDEALDFVNTYGATRSGNGFLCIVTRYDISGKVEQEVKTSGTCSSLTARDVMFTYSGSKEHVIDPDMTFAVRVFAFENAGTFNIEYLSKSSPESQSSTKYSFVIDDDKNVTETDIYGWLPDCYSEYSAFSKKNGKVSYHDDYLVICDTHTDGMTTTQTLLQDGNGRFDEASVKFYFPVSVEPMGGFSGMIRLYKPVEEGLVKVTWENRPNSGDSVLTESKSFRIGKGLNIYPVADSEFDNISKADVNGDERLTVADLVVYQQYILCGRAYSGMTIPDLCEDGKIDAFDLVVMRKMLTAADDFPVEDEYCRWNAGCNVQPKDGAYLANSMEELLNIVSANDCCNDESCTKKVSAEETLPANINEEFFKNYSVIAIYDHKGSSSRQISYEGCERSGSVLIVKTSVYTPMAITADDVYHRMFVAVKKSAVSGVKKVERKNSANKIVIDVPAPNYDIVTQDWERISCNDKIAKNSIYCAESMDELKSIITAEEICEAETCSLGKVDVNKLIPDNIGDDFFKEYNAVVLYNECGSGSRSFSFDGIEKRDGEMFVYTKTKAVGDDGDKKYFRTIISVKKDYMEDVHQIYRHESYFCEDGSVRVEYDDGGFDKVTDKAMDSLVGCMKGSDGFTFRYNRDSELNHYVGWKDDHFFDVYYKGYKVCTSDEISKSDSVYVRVSSDGSEAVSNIKIPMSKLEEFNFNQSVLGIQDIAKIIGTDSTSYLKLAIYADVNGEDCELRFVYIDENDYYCRSYYDAVTGEKLCESLHPIP